MCSGLGMVASNDAVALNLLRILEAGATSGRVKEIQVAVSAELTLHLLNQRRADLVRIEESCGVTIVLSQDLKMSGAKFEIIAPKALKKEVESVSTAKAPPTGEKEKPKRSRRGGRGRKKQNEGDDSAAENTDVNTEPAADSDSPENDEEKKPRRRSRRGGGGRKKADNSNESDATQPKPGEPVPKPVIAEPKLATPVKSGTAVPEAHEKERRKLLDIWRRIAQLD